MSRKANVSIEIAVDGGRKRHKGNLDKAKTTPLHIPRLYKIAKSFVGVRLNGTGNNVVR